MHQMGEQRHKFNRIFGNVQPIADVLTSFLSICVFGPCIKGPTGLGSEHKRKCKGLESHSSQTP